jgi:hypothetical protein
VPLKNWKRALIDEEYKKSFPYAFEFELEIIAERGISLDGKDMRKKTFERIVYGNVLVEGNGIYKPENPKYGRI